MSWAAGPVVGSFSPFSPSQFFQELRNEIAIAPLIILVSSQRNIAPWITKPHTYVRFLLHHFEEKLKTTAIL